MKARLKLPAGPGGRVLLGLLVIALCVAVWFSSRPLFDAKPGAGQQALRAKYQVWLNGLDLKNIEWTTVPHQRGAVQYGLPPLGLADLLSGPGTPAFIMGTTKSITPLVRFGTQATFSVTNVVRGSLPANMITVDEFAHLEASQFGTDSISGPPVIVEGAAEPFLVPRQSLILVVVPVDSGSGYQIVPWGEFALVGGTVHAIPDTPVARQLDGMKVSAFVELVKSLPQPQSP